MPTRRRTSDGLGIREYARHRKERGLPGATHTAVENALRDGRITRNRHGKIDPKKADADWARNTARSPAKDTAAAASKGPSIHDSRAIREAYSAQQARLDYYERVGRLTDAQAVEQEFFALFRKLRESLLSVVPPRVGPLVAAEEDAAVCEQIVEDAMREALDAVRRK